jgi:hypothetical protein
VGLVSALADSPSTIFHTLAETIKDITQCDSAGLSLLTRDGKTPHVDGQRFLLASHLRNVQSSRPEPNVILTGAETCAPKIVLYCSLISLFAVALCGTARTTRQTTKA